MSGRHFLNRREYVVGWKIINIDNVYKFVFILFIPLLERYVLYLIQLRLNPAVNISLVYLKRSELVS